MLWFVVIRNQDNSVAGAILVEHWPCKCSKRGGEDKVESVLGRREVQNTAHPRSYLSALSGGESIGGDEV